jgi:hypothetical protein
MRKQALNKLAKGEKGQALMIVVLLMLVSALVIAPVLAHVSTGLKTGKEVYEERMQLFYAADSGIEDGLWQVDNEQLDTLFTDYDKYAYYDYSSSNEWDYDLPEDLNSKEVNVALRNIWIPKGIAAPSPNSAKDIIEGIGGESPALVISGNVSALSTYQINIAYYYDSGADPGGAGLEVDTIGIWLPPGFNYAGNCSLEGEPFYSAPDDGGYCSGRSVVWPFSSTPLTDFPGSAGYPLERSFTFQFSGPASASPGAALSWIDTSGVDGVDYAWDADVKVYKVTSTATDAATGKNTTVDAYTAVSEIRDLGSSTSGDYLAIGNSLIGGNGHWPDNYHYQLYNSTQSSISTDSDPTVGIPADANIEAAYLYWTGWIDWHGYEPDTLTVFQETCDDFVAPPMNWTAGSRWSIEGFWDKEFRGIGRGGGSANLLSFSSSLDLSDYEDETVIVSWQQNDDNTMEDDDYLYFALYDGSSWSDNILAFQGDETSPGTFSYVIPSDYLDSNFKLRFELDMNRSSDCIDLDDITIAVGGGSLEYPDNPTLESLQVLVEETARVNKVLFNDVPVTADAYQTLYPDQFVGDPTFGGTWFYTATSDVTDLIKQWIDDGDIESNGEGDYTLGHYYVGTSPSEDDYRVNEEDPDYYFDFYSGGGGTGYPLGTPSPSSHPSSSRYTAAHCGWSLLVIYSSPETYGHQLYLYDIQSPNFDFFFGWKNNADFDNDGEEGGTISGFLVPDPIAGETLAGRITVFVGEGDAGYTDDYFRVRGEGGSWVSLSNSASPANNVWNSKSPGLTVEGVDIDHFEITWSSGILDTGDTSVDIGIPTGTPPQDTDGFTMTYIILSFRSNVTSGGTISYLVRG